MNRTAYPFQKVNANSYRFISEGTENIEKAVVFEPLGLPDIMSLAFGDLDVENNIDDAIVTNNGDMLKVMATIVQVVVDFTKQFPHLSVLFSGSSVERTRFYGRILRMHHDDFVKEYDISGQRGELMERETFNLLTPYAYDAFMVKRIQTITLNDDGVVFFSAGTVQHSTKPFTMEQPEKKLQEVTKEEGETWYEKLFKGQEFTRPEDSPFPEKLAKAEELAKKYNLGKKL